MKLLYIIATAHLGMLALAAALPNEVSKRGVVYTDDETTTYHCDRDITVTACATAGGCSTVEECVIRCIQGFRSATCDNGLAGVKRDGEVDAEEASADLSNLSDESESSTVPETEGDALANPPDDRDYHKECSTTLRGILTCDWGFCSVHPGDWCALNARCVENPPRCVKYKRGEKVGTEIR